jgi:NADH-quinone oxidoreductase subunit L
MDTSLTLLLLAPFLGFLFNVFFGKYRKIASGIIGTLTVALSFAVSVYFSSK